MLIDAYLDIACFKLIVSSYSYELLRCPMHLCLLLYEGQAECYYAMFSLCEINKRLAKHYYSWIFCLCLFMLHHSFFVLLLELCLSCYDWSNMIPALNVLQVLWSSLWWCMSPQKLFFLFITYLLEDEHELSLGMLIHCKCIYNFWLLHAILSTVLGNIGLYYPLIYYF